MALKTYYSGVLSELDSKTLVSERAGPVHTQKSFKQAAWRLVPLLGSFCFIHSPGPTTLLSKETTNSLPPGNAVFSEHFFFSLTFSSITEECSTNESRVYSSEQPH